jgi:hypothetical protein
MPGAGCTHGPRAAKKARGRTTGSAEATGIPCAMVLRLIRDLPGDRAFLPPSPARRGTRLCELSASVGAPGPHDFAVRDHVIRLVTCRVHRIPLPTSVTIAKRPSYRVRDEADDPSDLGFTAIPVGLRHIGTTGSHNSPENASKQETRAPFRFNRNGKSSSSSG